MAAMDAARHLGARRGRHGAVLHAGPILPRRRSSCACTVRDSFLAPAARQRHPSLPSRPPIHALGNSRPADYKPHARNPPIHIVVTWGARPQRGQPARRCGRLGRNRGGLRARGNGSAAMKTPQARSGERLPVGLHMSLRSDVPPFIVMDVMEAAAAREAQGHKVIHMEVGQPGTPAPRAALDAVKRALDRETLGYTVALGLPELRARIAGHYRQRYGVDVAPERVVVTTGSSAGFVLAFLALFDAGAKVALPSPGYPCYRHILTALGQVPVLLSTDAASRWMPTARQIEQAATREGVSGLVIASPANPTGTMLEGNRLAEIVEACRHHKIWLVSDEIYHGLTYGLPEETALARTSGAIVVNSFSKYFSMTGWRVGWLVVPQELVRPVERLAQNLYISPPTVAQVAAIGAFDGLDELEV